MTVRSLVAFTCLSGLAAAASAQVITTPGITATLSLTWMEDPAFPHNDNGDLEPGEHALITMSLSFTGQNSAVSFSPPLGSFTGGTVLGLASAYVDIRGTGGDPSGQYNGGVTLPPSSSTGPNSNNTGTSGYGVRGGWRLGGNVANGTPVFNGFQNIGPGQLPTDPTGANVTNPIAAIERLSWVPNSFSFRYQTFSVMPAAGTNNNVVGLYLDLDGGTTGAAAYLPTSSITFGSVAVPIGIPSPGGLVVLAVGGLGVGGHRRRIG